MHDKINWFIKRFKTHYWSSVVSIRFFSCIKVSIRYFGYTRYFSRTKVPIFFFLAANIVENLARSKISADKNEPCPSPETWWRLLCDFLVFAQRFQALTLSTFTFLLTNSISGILTVHSDKGCRKEFFLIASTKICAAAPQSARTAHSQNNIFKSSRAANIFCWKKYMQQLR